MTITFYTTSSSPKKLNKTLTPIGSAVALAPTSQVSVLNPVLIVDNVSGFIHANYAYIDDFHRYYWITTAYDTSGRIIVSCKVDYLMSWAAGIRQCPSNIIRADLGSPTYVIDKKYPIDPTRFYTQGITFPETQLSPTNGVVYPQYIMITR